MVIGRAQGGTVGLGHGEVDQVVLRGLQGAKVERDGSESEAYLSLPRATLDSRVTEMLDEQIAQTDYHIKVQAKQFWGFLAELQEVRRSAIKAQKSSAS